MKASSAATNHILQKLIRAGIGRARFVMATAGLGIAIFLILLAVQTFLNFHELLHGRKNENDTADFLVISKSVSGSGAGQKDQSAFSKSETDSLRMQPFVQELGMLSAANFSVNVSSYSDAIPFYSDAFFESVPDHFLDVKPESWGWQPGQRDLPVIIPNFFLDLYNTGLAMSRENFPQLSLEALMAIPLRVIISGNGRQTEYVGHIAGSSDRINSILVPQSFMDWANTQFGYRQTPVANRIVIKTKDPSNPELVTYLGDRNWQTNTDKTRFSRIRVIVNWIVGIVGGIGLVMLLFGMLVFSLFIQLTIASSRMDIELLITVGASPNKLQRFLMQQFWPVNAAIIGAVLLVLQLIQYLLHRQMLPRDMYVHPYVHPATLAAALLVFVLIWATNRTTIRRYLSVV